MAIERRDFLTGAGAAVAAAAAGHPGVADAQTGASTVPAAPATHPADFVLVNGQVITVDGGLTAK